MKFLYGILPPAAATPQNHIFALDLQHRIGKQRAATGQNPEPVLHQIRQSAAQIAQGLQKEAELIRAKLPKGCFFCVLTPEGRLLSSGQLADTLRQAKLGGRSGVCFLIGSSFGIAPEIKALADLQLSMSRMTFPHHLARVMALEQLYRAEAIQAGSKYHK